MFRLTIKGILSHKRRLVGTCSAIILGVAFLAGTLVLGDTMRADFDSLFRSATAGTDAVVRGSTAFGDEMESQRQPVDASLMDTIAELPDVEAVAPELEGVGQIVGADGKAIGGNGPPTIGGNWIDNPDLTPWRLAEGRAPASQGEVVIDRGSAEAGDLTIGATTTVRTPAPIPVTVVGIATFDEYDSLSTTTYAAFTLEEAEQYFSARPGLVSSIIVSAVDGVSEEELVASISPLVASDSVEVLTGAELTSQLNEDIQNDFLGFFETFLLVFAGIALLVATFSIYNTFSIIVAQRTRESALLRAIGASRRQVLGSIGLEALLVGLLASAVGIGLGIGLAVGLGALLDAAGMGISTGALAIEPASINTSVVVGVVVTVLASISPAIKASRVPPIAALRDVAIDRTGASKARAVLGAALSAVGVAVVLATALNGGDGALARAGLGAVATIVGLVVLGPVVARPASRVIGTPLPALRGVTGNLARENAMRNPRRTAGTAAALMIGVGVVGLFTVVAASITRSVDEVVEQSFAGDLVMESTNFSGSGITPDLAPALQAMPEVDGAVGLGFGAVQVRGSEPDLTIAPPAEVATVMDLDVAQGALETTSEDGIAISSRWAEDHGLALGDAVPVDFADGQSEVLTVGAVYDSWELMGDMIMGPSVFNQHANQPMDFVVLVSLAEGVSLDAGKAAITPVAEQFGAPEPMDRDEYIDTVASGVDQMLTVVYAMLGLAILIALMGIANTLALSIHERTRELGLLRAVGQTRAQLRAMVRWESVIIALFGTVGGLGLGVFLGWALVKAAGTEEGLAAFAIPTTALVVLLALGALAGVLAGVRPARRAAKLDVLGAIAGE
ncbi:MAG: FtsX-like permease family protein [Acidimicrobiia bacterium]|nr:FtsX-like permease family protein [Acidimicrobiia bacterium]